MKSFFMHPRLDGVPATEYLSFHVVILVRALRIGGRHWEDICKFLGNPKMDLPIRRYADTFSKAVFGQSRIVNQLLRKEMIDEFGKLLNSIVVDEQ